MISLLNIFVVFAGLNSVFTMWILKTRNAPAVLAPLLCSTSKLSSNTQGLTTDTDTDTDTVISLGLIAYNSFKQFQFIYIFVCFCYHNILN